MAEAVETANKYEWTLGKASKLKPTQQTLGSGTEIKVALPSDDEQGASKAVATACKSS
jgi:hypothetical protein